MAALSRPAAPTKRSQTRRSIPMKDLSLKPYAPWFYAFEPDRRGPFCGTLLVFPTQAHVDVARTGNPALTEYVFDDLLEAGRTPVTAAIGLREDYEEYRAIRRDWIGTAIDSLVAKVDLTIKESTDRNAFPGDLFHNMIFLADKLY